MADPYEGHTVNLDSPGVRHQVVVPSDTVNLPTRARALICTSSGDVVVRDEAGVDVTYSMQVGERLDFRAVRVLATGTTGSVVAWW